MRVLYLEIPRFPVQRRGRELPSLSGKPFVLEAEDRGHRRVAFASAAALEAGIQPGMVLTAACALRSDLETFPYRAEEESAALGSLGEALLTLGPAYQKDGSCGLWLDASAAALCGGELGLGARVLELALAHGYRGRAAIASEPFTARAVARWGRERIAIVAAQESGSALARLPLAALDVGAGVQSLSALGLSCLGEVAALPSGALVARLGAFGLRVQRLCRGEDDSALVPTPVAEVVEESVALDWPAEAMEPLLFSLKTVIDRVCARLSGRKQAAVRLTLRLKLDPSGTREVGLTLARPTAQARLLLDLSKHRIADLTLENPVGGLSLRVDEACEDRGQQLALGQAPSGDASLEVVLSRLSTALGDKALFSAALADSHRPEAAYAAKAFRPPEAPAPMEGERRAWFEGDTEADAPPALDRPSRLFATAANLDAEVDGRGTLVAARVLGKRRKVTALSGPERLAGEWWAESAYSRDYYRVFFEGLGPAWIYRSAQDGRFYLQGMFD